MKIQSAYNAFKRIVKLDENTQPMVTCDVLNVWNPVTGGLVCGYLCEDDRDCRDCAIALYKNGDC